MTSFVYSLEINRIVLGISKGELFLGTWERNKTEQSNLSVLRVMSDIYQEFCVYVQLEHIDPKLPTFKVFS